MLHAVIIFNFMCLLGWAAAAGGKTDTADQMISVVQEINKEKVPYMVKVFEEHMASNGRTRVFICEGSLISGLHVLTSANCVWEYKLACRDLWVGFPSNIRDDYYIMAISVWKIILHPSYTRLRSLEDDVAILQMTSPTAFTESIKPIFVAENEPFSGQVVQLSGWGKSFPNSCTVPNLRAVKLSLIDRESCQEIISSGSEPRFQITSKLLCAKIAKRRTCGGGSGGPLTLNDTLVGMVSWGNEFCNEPGLFTNLADPEIRTFIRNVTRL